MKLIFLFLPPFLHSTDVLEAYIKTDGAWIVKLPKVQYSVKTVEECAVKCNKETSFTCRCKSDHNYNSQNILCSTSADSFDVNKQ